MFGIEQALQIAQSTAWHLWKETTLSSSGEDGQTLLMVAFHGEGHSPLPSGKKNRG